MSIGYGTPVLVDEELWEKHQLMQLLGRCSAGVRRADSGRSVGQVAMVASRILA